MTHTHVTRTQKLAWLVLGVVALASLAAGVLAPSSYSEQFRDSISAAPSARFLLGTDELGRDRFARLLYGTRISLLLAPAAAFLSTLIAAVIGGTAGYLGGRWERAVTSCIDLFLSLPWLFLLLTVRALLPLNTSPVTSVMITFLLLGCLGWAMPARIIRAGTRTLVHSDYLVGPGRRHFAPASVLAALASESTPDSARSVLGFDSGLHFERGESGTAGVGCFRAFTILGRHAARTRKLHRRAPESVDACTGGFTCGGGVLPATSASD